MLQRPKQTHHRPLFTCNYARLELGRKKHRGIKMRKALQLNELSLQPGLEHTSAMDITDFFFFCSKKHCEEELLFISGIERYLFRQRFRRGSLLVSHGLL